MSGINELTVARIVPGRGHHAGKFWLLHGCFSDGPYDSYADAHEDLKLLLRYPLSAEDYAAAKMAGHDGRAYHYLRAHHADCGR